MKSNSTLLPYGYNSLKLQEIEVMILCLMIVCLKSNIPRLSQFSFYWNIPFFQNALIKFSTSFFSIGCNFKNKMSCYQFTFQTLLDSDKLKESQILHIHKMIITFQYDFVWYQVTVKQYSDCFKISLVMNLKFFCIYGMHLNERDSNECPQEFLKGKYLLILW